MADDLRTGAAVLDRNRGGSRVENAEEGKLSGTVLLTHRERTVLSRSYGKANERKSLPKRSDTIFALASVAKLFTATTIRTWSGSGEPWPGTG
ncbi:serine hydrolase [Nonomuraea rubra]|uniref:serine hydrolase n=1 Tax=Nonomuraea rubra TaxID=46180 RepID=UPI00340498C5